MRAAKSHSLSRGRRVRTHSTGAISARRSVRTRSLFHHTLLRAPSFEAGSEEPAWSTGEFARVPSRSISRETSTLTGAVEFHGCTHLVSHLVVTENPPAAFTRDQCHDVYRQDFRSVSRAPRSAVRETRRKLAARISRGEERSRLFRPVVRIVSIPFESRVPGVPTPRLLRRTPCSGAGRATSLNFP